MFVRPAALIGALFLTGCDFVDAGPIPTGTPDLIVEPGAPPALGDTICSIDAMADANNALFSYWWNKGDDLEMYSLRYTDRAQGFEIVITQGADEPAIWFMELRDKSRPMDEIERRMEPFEKAMTNPQTAADCDVQPTII